MNTNFILNSKLETGDRAIATAANQTKKYHGNVTNNLCRPTKTAADKQI